MLLKLDRAATQPLSVSPPKWSPKQRQYGRLHQLKKHVFARGSVRSGKSKSMIHGWNRHMHNWFGGYDHMLAAIDYKAANAIYMDYLEESCWQMGIKMSGHETTHLEIPARRGPPNRIWVFGGRAKEAAARALGYTFQTEMFGEVVNHNPHFVANSFDRASLPNAHILADYNPLAPTHWFKLGYEDGIVIENEDGTEGMVQPHLTIHLLEDNPVNTPQYIAETKGRYRNQPAEYARKILGQWAAIAGLVYAMVLQPAEHAIAGPRDFRNVTRRPEREPDYLALGVDYGERGTTAAGKIGFWKDLNRYWLYDEWHHEGKSDGYRTDIQQAQDIADWAKSGRRPDDVFVDATAKGLITQLRKRMRGVRPLQFDLVPSVKVLQTLFEELLCLIDPQCRWTLAELGNYEWDDNTRYKDRIKLGQADHHMDTMRLGFLGGLIRRARSHQHQQMIQSTVRIGP